LYIYTQVIYILGYGSLQTWKLDRKFIEMCLERCICETFP